MSDQAPVCVHDSWKSPNGWAWRIRLAGENEPPFGVEVKRNGEEWGPPGAGHRALFHLAHRVVQLVSWLGMANVRAQDAGKWVRTAERPPEINRGVLVAVRGLSRPVTGVYGRDGRWHIAYAGSESGEPYAWCEMPAVPLGWES